MLFAEGVPNAAAAHLSLMLSLKGPCQTIIGTRTAGLDAIRLAAARIASGAWDRAIVGAAEEYSPVVNAAYGHWGLYGPDGFANGAGAVTFLLESRVSLAARAGRERGRIVSSVGAMPHPGGPMRVARRVLRQLTTVGLILGSGNGTWIDRAEAAAARDRGGAVISPYGCIAECFSALPLAGIAGVLLTRRVPHRGDVSPPSARSFCAIGTDYTGAVSGVCMECR
jgi:hypothetical protein